MNRATHRSTWSASTRLTSALLVVGLMLMHSVGANPAATHGVLQSEQTGSRARPNILWITTDQQRFDTIHALGNKHIRTPHLDRLAREGTAFTHAYVQSTVCTPSRASMYTGYYPSTLHVNRNGNSYFPEEASKRLISRTLADAGYDTGMIGKLHLSSAQERVEPRPDDKFRLYLWSHHPKPETAWGDANAYQHWLQIRGVDWNKAYRAVRLPGWADEFQPGIEAKHDQTTWCADEAIRFINVKRDGKPWFFNINMFDPHPPFDPPAEYLKRIDTAVMPLPHFRTGDLETQRTLAKADYPDKVRAPDTYQARQMVAAYYAQIELIDDQLGRILEALDKSGQRENTIIIFTSDHGDMLGDHGLLYKGCRFYEGAVRVPLIIAWRKEFKAAVQSRALVELTDIVPTLLENLDLPIPAQMQGKTLLPILRGAANPNQHRAFVRSEYYDALELPNRTHATMYREARYKLVVYHSFNSGELYDLERDPHEFTNLWNDPASDELRGKLLQASFNASLLATDSGQPRRGRY